MGEGGEGGGNPPSKPKQEEGEEQLTCYRMTIGSGMHEKLDLIRLMKK